MYQTNTRIFVNPQTHEPYPGDDAEVLYLQNLSSRCYNCMIFGHPDCSECYRKKDMSDKESNKDFYRYP